MSVPSQVVFDYTNCIRLLCLDPGEKADPISATLEAILLSDETLLQEWEAVSYRWDTSGEKSRITVNGSNVSIAQNLQRMLIDLRLATRKRYLWIDAICIDQSDDDEKSAQLPMMRLIYEQASQVIIWLDCSGRENEATAVYKAAEFLADSESQEAIKRSGAPLRTVFRQHVADIEWNTPFHKILRLPWFQRIWVVQEAVLAKQLVFHLFEHTISWQDFADAALKYMSMEGAWLTVTNHDYDAYHRKCRSMQYDNSVMSGLTMVYLILRLRKWMFEPSLPLPPSEWVYLCKDRKATDPRDMIFGVTSLFDLKRNPNKLCRHDNFFHYLATSQGSNFHGLGSACYSFSKEDLYMAFSSWCIGHEQNLDILAQVRNENGLNLTVGLPSWAVDWTKQERDTFQTSATMFSLPTEWYPLKDSQVSLQEYQYNAIPIHTRQFSHRQGKRLFVRGYILDTLGPTINWPDYRHQSQEDMNDSNPTPRWVRTALEKINSPTNRLSNMIMFGTQTPTIQTLKAYYTQTQLNDEGVWHLWRGDVGNKQHRTQVRLSKSEFRSTAITERGWVVKTFPFYSLDPPPKICYLIGGRGLFVLAPAGIDPETGTSLYRLISGDCYLNGTEDGEGLHLCQKLGLEEQEICLI
jgi:hypothetical protein